MSLIIRSMLFFILSIYHSGVFAHTCNAWCEKFYQCQTINDNAIDEPVIYPENYDKLCEENIFYAKHLAEKGIDNNDVDKQHPQDEAYQKTPRLKEFCQESTQCTQLRVLTGVVSAMNYAFGEALCRGMNNCCLTCNPTCCGHLCAPHLAISGKAFMNSACNPAINSFCCRFESAQQAAGFCCGLSNIGYVFCLLGNMALLRCCVSECYKRMKKSQHNEYAQVQYKREGRGFNCKQQHQADHDALSILAYEIEEESTKEFILSMLQSDLKKISNQSKENRYSAYDDEQPNLISLQNIIGCSLKEKVKKILENDNPPKTYSELIHDLVNL
ncbi:MAG: hypothetical protein PUP46_09650 [Endozoicomonas sp. (ex Botrylloides leachii)]|nr:hypothetical protein [Endozoicomonas sp. (ex Botrylloides leachii)]